MSPIRSAPIPSVPLPSPGVSTSLGAVLFPPACLSVPYPAVESYFPAPTPALSGWTDSILEFLASRQAAWAAWQQHKEAAASVRGAAARNTGAFPLNLDLTQDAARKEKEGRALDLNVPLLSTDC